MFTYQKRHTRCDCDEKHKHLKNTNIHSLYMYENFFIFCCKFFVLFIMHFAAYFKLFVKRINAKQNQKSSALASISAF